MDITVAIPTYNGATRLPEVFAQLQKQVGTEDIEWEILVVDNNSADNTPEVIAHYQRILPQMRSCLEPKQGAGFARHRAFWEARGELVAFLDDDTIPDRTWVKAVMEFAHIHPHTGAYGSQVHADYAVPPPPNFSRIAPFLAITERGSRPLLYAKNNKLLPPSAGLVVRSRIWKQYVPKEMILSGRIEGNMLTSEDLEMLSYIQASPWEIWYNPAMEITHKIPASRLQRNYLIPFLRGIGRSRYVTRTISTTGFKKYFITCAYFANDLKKILWHLLKYRTKVRTDLVAACELELLTSSLISPLFLAWKGYLHKK